MKNFYFIEPSIEIYEKEEYLDAEFIFFEGSMSINANLNSKKIVLKDEHFRFNCKRENLSERDLLLTNKKWFMPSEKLFKILNKHQQMDFFSPKILVDPNLEIKKKYKLVRLPIIPGLINKDSSELIMNPVFQDRIMGIKKIVLKKCEKINNTNIFLMKEYPVKAIISEELKNELKKSNISGVTITNITEYNW